MNKALLSRISFSLSSQLHVLRHFSNIDESYLGAMSSTLKNKILEYKGSKFNSEFAHTPKEIIAQTQALGTLIFFKNANYRQVILCFSFSKRDFPNGIGITIPKNKLSNIKPKLTWQLNIILHRNKNKWEITTCFPGAYNHKDS